MVMMMMIIIIIITRNYGKQPYSAQDTYFGNYECKISIDSTLKLTI